jgi:hypothetical protein
MQIILPLAEGPSTYQLNEAGPLPVIAGPPPTSRIAYAAAHVVVDPLRPQALDMKSTIAFRHHLWSLGFGVAEAMDTSAWGWIGLPHRN